jgi:glycosyltransferase involved in cell wall biosynthesis
VVNTHIWWADAFYHRVLSLFAPGEPRPRWVLSMHGCYELLRIIPKLDSYYELNSDAVIRDSDAIVYIADKNTAPLIARLPIAEKITKLAHGYALPEVCAVKRTALGIAENDFVFGIVSRAIPQKGWECAIEALQIVHARGFPQSHLVLVGGGDFQRELADRYAQRPHLHFAGSVSDPHNYVAIFDVGLLPTWFVSESLPGTIIEYLAQGKPVIATSLGEIPNMLRLGDDVAGIILPGGPDQPVAPETLAGAMMEMLQDGTKRKRFASVAARAAGRFGMEKWLAAYSRILFPSDLMAPAFDLQASSGEQRRARKF